VTFKTYGVEDSTRAIEDIQRFFMMKPKGKLDIGKHSENRNEIQQAKLHALIREIATHVGMDENGFKQDVLKRNSEGVFASWPMYESNDLEGNVVMRPKSESKLNKVEEAHVIEMLYVLGSEQGMSWTNAA